MRIYPCVEKHRSESMTIQLVFEYIRSDVAVVVITFSTNNGFAIFTTSVN